MSYFKFLVGSLMIVVLYQNCSAVHDENASISSFEACNLVLKNEFISGGYHDFLKSNCSGCHKSGSSGNGAFGDSSVDIAFDAFNIRGYELVETRALDANHQPPFTGSQHQQELNQIDQGWLVAKQQADACIANAGIDTGGGGIDDGIVPDDSQPTQGTIDTFVKLTQPDKDGTVIRWNLETEIKDPSGLSFPNAEIEVRVTALTSVTGEKSYTVSNPIIRGGDSALHLQFIAIKINNQLVDTATSYHRINRRVPIGETRKLSEGAMIFSYDVRNTDVISLSIGNLENVTWDPPTFQELNQAGGVFQTNCASCHTGANPQAGFNISVFSDTNSDNATYLQGVWDQLLVSPFSPNNSEIFKRMNDTQSPMPQSGLLPAADTNEILWWIQDGATECGYQNDGDTETNCP